MYIRQSITSKTHFGKCAFIEKKLEKKEKNNLKKVKARKKLISGC